MDKTTNYNLNKPLGTERFHVENWNDNFDIIDTTMKTHETAFGYTVTSVMDNVTLTEANTILFADTINKNITVTLPTVVNNKFKYFIRKVDASANTLTINTSNSEIIEGSTSYEFQYGDQSVSIVSDGSKWFIIDKMVLTGYGY
jgi:hypothetical protein